MFSSISSLFTSIQCRRKPQRRVRPRLEGLEDRSCPSCTLNLFSPDAGQIGLLIEGDKQPDTILVRDLGPSQTGKGSLIEVNGDGKSQVFDNIMQVAVRSGGGNDDVSYGGFFGGVRLAVDSGPGNDKVSIFPGFLGQGSIEVNSGDGNDDISYS